MEKVQFKISSALKNLIGKELITDEFVAVFELVKNSFDANAKNVKVIFENQYNPQTSKILIWDDGRGMNLDDLHNKWLFVGYSAKKDGSEDKDYRDKLKNKRTFAGAKGVGRFSCDRLGAHLELITKKETGKYENLSINWTDFEEDAKREFMNVRVLHQTLVTPPFQDFVTGTILEISQLRDQWDRERILLLKNSLEKLINPNQANEDGGFQIEIIAGDEKLQDQREISENKKVNGVIKNFIFEKLGLKTTQIRVEIIENGGIIKTTLIDRGREIYWVRERNTYTLLSDINIHLFQLNRAAKYNFTKQMQIEPVKYGSVFIYKNGFRIYPFGEEGDDSLGIDRRKQQGYNRFLGTRDLIGRIEVSGDYVDLKETTSRDRGFIKNDTYKELIDLFYDKALRRLERYVVDIIKWGDERINKETGEIDSELTPEDVKKEILEIISNLTKSNNIIDVGYDEDFLDIYSEAQSKSVTKIAQNIMRAAEKTNDPEIINQAKSHVSQVEKLLSAKKEAESEVEVIKEEKNQIEKQLSQKTKQVLFLQSIDNLDKDRIVQYHHDIGVHSGTIQNWIDKIVKKIKKEQNISSEELIRFLEAISRANKKILAISRFATKANFNTTGEILEADIIEYMIQYVSGILPEFYHDLKFHCEGGHNGYIVKFKPLEISLLLDNLVSNSIKAKAHNFNIDFRIKDSLLYITIYDDGAGLSATIQNPDSIFEKGITTTSGSGLGLYNVHHLITKEMGGEIAIIPESVGFKLQITLHK